MSRSKEELQEALELFDRALQGDADAFIEIWEIVQDEDNNTNGGVKDGKNKQRDNCSEKKKS